MTYRFLPHTADIRVGLDAPTFPALLDDVVAIIRRQSAGDGPVEARTARPVAAVGDDAGELLFAFARDVLAAFQVDRFVPARFELEALGLPPEAKPALRGRLWGESFDPARHEVQPEIKALTRHGFTVLATPAGGWRAELLFDV